ncbi:Glycosyltransferase 6 domain-containing protein 1 [Frankliniella fusca]|uniref:Glycosyltransferase 6 domain-containing protein 1 n=2 Tax=Frankliniella fusca TaxID=407009 RepID=A0AAE1HWU2_9NEOP|nr:Glycosyltransferase 6 domain-containing protein 1 [Frankliniella fusca]KAK3928992.1 Glycosyltransferase 6 domain-containing protein 1 [Frankliniella fusca]
MEVCALLYASNGLSVLLTEMELVSLLDPRWVPSVLLHFKTPKNPGNGRVLENVEFRCCVIGNGEPGLRISKRTDNRIGYIVLAETSVLTLIDLADAILCTVSTLKNFSVECENWLLDSLRVLKEMSEEMSIPIQTEQDAASVLAVYKKELAACEMLTPETMFVLDLAYMYKEQFSRMLFDFVHTAVEDVSKLTNVKDD